MLQQINAILRPLDANTAYLPTSALVSISPVLVETVLFARILAVYPWSRISLTTKLVAYGVPITMRIVRTVNVAVGLSKAAQIYRDNKGASISVPEEAWQTITETKVECFLQLFDNT